MKAARFPSQGAKLEIVQVPIPKPQRDEVRIKVICCGICHGDIVCQHGGMGNTWPRTPGHELVGFVDEVGELVSNVKKGDYVGVGWFGGSCGTCDFCVHAEFDQCPKNLICGASIDGGYAEYVVIRNNAVVQIPKELKPEDAAPLMCAGLTTFNALRNSGARPGELVVIQGIGGLGHMGVQYARKMGFHTVAVSRGNSKAELAKQLGAHQFFNESQDIVKEIKALGGAKVILSTVTDGKSIEKILPALGKDGKLLIVGAIREPLSVHTLPMLGLRQSLGLWVSGGPRDIADTLKFSCLQDVRPVIEEYPLDKAPEAYAHAMGSNARCRVVLKIS